MLNLADQLVEVAIYALIINAVTYFLFGFDKRAAERGGSRVPEKTLLLASALGGSAGAILAQRRFHHKTKKQPFKTLLFAIIAMHIILILALMYTRL
jgi:uncharacterized membrane protein YsdA (DUF1294 family)